MEKKIIYIIIGLLTILILLFSFSNKKMSVENKYEPPNFGDIGGGILFNSNVINFSDNGMASKNVQTAVDEIYSSFTDGCSVGYLKGTTSDGLYVCNKRTVDSTQTVVFAAGDVNYDNTNSGLTSTNVSDAILELAAKIPDCITGYHKDNATSSAYECIINTLPSTLTTTNNNVTLTYGTTSGNGYTYNGNGTVNCSSSDTTKVTCSVNTSTGEITLTPVNKTTTSVTITVSATATPEYYAPTNATFTVVVNPKPVPVSVTSCNNKTYDRLTSASCTISATGIVAGDTATVTGQCAFADYNVGTNKTVTCNTFTISNSNYTVSTNQATKTANITAKALTAATPTNCGKTYDGGTGANCTVSYSNVISGDTVDATASCSYANKTVANNKTVTCSGFGKSGASAGNYSVPSGNVTTTANITARQLTANTPSCTSKTYNGNTTANCTVSFGNVVSGDQVNATASCNYADANVGTNKTVTCSSYGKSGNDAGNYTLPSGNATTTASITAQACNAPTNVSISTAGKVTWTASSNCSSAQHQISINNSTWTNASSGVDYKSTIIAATGTRTVYVRAVAPNSNYSTSGNGTKSTTVYSVTLSYNSGAGISAVSGGGNYITGSSVTLGATVSSGYTWSKWTQTTGGADVSTTQAYSATITGNWTYTANATANSYTVTYYPNGGSGSNTNQSVTYNTSWTTKGAIFSRTGYTLSGWSTSSTGSVTHNLNTSQGTWTRTSNLPLYAVWTPNTYTLVYNKGKGYVSGTMEDTTCTVGTACQVRHNAFYKTDEEFRGWATDNSSDSILKVAGPSTGSGELVYGGMSGNPALGNWYFMFFDAKGTGTITIEIYDSARSMGTSYTTSWSGSNTGSGTTSITLNPNSSTYNLYYIKWNITSFPGGANSTQWLKITSNNASNAVQNVYVYKLGGSSTVIVPGDSYVYNLASSGTVNLYALWYYVGSSGGGGTGGGSTGGGGCFLPGTPVYTSDGYKNIEDIKIGDTVLSYNEITKDVEYKEVSELYVHENNNDDLYEIDIGSSKLKVTAVHKFYVERNYKYYWIAAKDLKVGDKLMYQDGTYHAITHISYMPYYGTVYNFKVEDNHTYFVGDDGILVHNSKSYDCLGAEFCLRP